MLPNILLYDNIFLTLYGWIYFIFFFLFLFFIFSIYFY